MAGEQYTGPAGSVLEFFAAVPDVLNRPTEPPLSGSFASSAAAEGALEWARRRDSRTRLYRRLVFLEVIGDQ